MRPIVLNDQSPGAPILSGQDGSLYTVLKWALPQLGWTLEYDDPPAYAAAFRNDPLLGTGYFLKVVDGSSAFNTSANSRFCRVMGYDDMTGIDAGTGGWAISSDRYWTKSSSADSTIRPYYVIGDSQTFYFAADAFSNGVFRAGGAGDYESFLPADFTNFLLLSKGFSDNPVFDRFGIGPFASNKDAGSAARFGPALAKDYLSTSDGVSVDLVALPPNDLENRQFSGQIGQYPDPISGGLNVGKAFLLELGIQAMRGALRGLRVAHNDIKTLAPGTIISGVDSGNGPEDAIVIPYRETLGIQSAQGALIFNLGEW